MPIEINHISALHSNDGVIQNQGQLFVGNRSDVNESQSVDINSINLNNHVANDCESTSGSDSIATRVRAKNAKARQKNIHASSSEPSSYEY